MGLIRTLKLAYWPRPVATPAAADEDEPIPQKPSGTADTQSAAAAYGAAVDHLINRPDTIRARAQVSATISAAVAAALAAFAPLTGLGTREPWLQGLVALAIVSWLVSLWRYILVISYSYQTDQKQIESDAEEKTDDKLEQHLYKFVAYAARMRTKVERGTAATQVALGLTLAAAAALAIEGVVGRDKPLVVSLTADGLEALDTVCEQTIDDPVVDAQGRPDDLKLSVVPLRLPEGSCGKDAVVVHLRRGWIEAARAD